MNEIVKFIDYKKINEDVIIPVVDAVISRNGDLNTKENRQKNNLPLKGNVELWDKPTEVRGADVKYTDKKTGEVRFRPGPFKTERSVFRIKGLDGLDYPGGLDKNGNLVGSKFDTDGNLMTVRFRQKAPKKKRSDEAEEEKDPSYINYNESEWEIDPNFVSKKISIPGELRGQLSEEDQKYPYWNKKVNYIKLVPTTPTGWVNVKVDMEVIKRVRRYSIGLSPEDENDTSVKSFLKKLKNLDRISNKAIEVKKISRQDIQQQMSAIILLHYINEIKTFFNPSMAGSLFESFLGGLIPNAKVTEDNGKADISVTTPEGEVGYQVKLYGPDTSNIDITYKTEDGVKKPLDYYLICIKKTDMIVIYVLNSVNKKSSGYYDNFRSKGPNSQSFSMSKINDIGKLNIRDESRFSISIMNLEQRIADLGTGLKSSLDSLYLHLSKFQYNVESIISGVDEETQKIMSDDKFTQTYKEATLHVGSMTKELESLYKNINKRTRR